MGDIGLFLIGQHNAHNGHSHQPRFRAQLIGEGKCGEYSHHCHGRFQE